MQDDIVVYCGRCATQRHMTKVGSYINAHDEPPSRYTFGHCAHCRDPFVVCQGDFSGLGKFDDDESVAIFPPDERQLTFAVPDIVRISYDEAIGCERAKRWMATAVMVGRTLEAVCKNELPNEKGSMFVALKKLNQQGKISQELADWADALRFLRNIGAHATPERVDREDAVDAVNFLQSTLETLYHLRPRFQQMNERRKRKKQAVEAAANNREGDAEEAKEWREGGS